MNPKQAKGSLVKKYGNCMEKACDSWQPEGVNGNAWRNELIYHWFACLVELSIFYLAYPADVGSPCGPPGFRDRTFLTLFIHGHLNDPTFMRPKEPGIVGWAMHLKMKEPAPYLKMIDVISNDFYNNTETEPKLEYSPKKDPAVYKYENFGYFMLMDDEWHAIKEFIAFDTE